MCDRPGHTEGAVTKVAAGGMSYTCVHNKGEKVKRGPGTEYFEGGCNFGCRDTLKGQIK